MEIEWNTIINSSIGSLIAVAGSLFVAFRIIGNQNKAAEKAHTSEVIRDVYFDKGVFPIETSISSYGSSTASAFNDVVKYLNKYYSENEAFYSSKILEIMNRPDIKDLINRHYFLASKYYSRNLIFGPSFYTAVKRTHQLYSDFLLDLLSPGIIAKQLIGVSINELSSSLLNMSKLFQQAEFYMETRCEYLIEYILEKNYQTLSGFVAIREREDYQGFLVELQEYIDYLDEFRKAFRGAQSTSVQRELASSNFSKWLVEHNDINPFTN